MRFRGYISSRKLSDGNFVDQSIQNLIIRTACEKLNIKYMLSATEYGMKECFLMLNQVMRELKKNKFDGVAFFSIDQLPTKYKDRKKIYKLVSENKKKILMSLEGILLSNQKEIEKFEELIKIRLLLKNCPKNLIANEFSL